MQPNNHSITQSIIQPINLFNHPNNHFNHPSKHPIIQLFVHSFFIHSFKNLYSASCIQSMSGVLRIRRRTTFVADIDVDATSLPPTRTPSPNKTHTYTVTHTYTQPATRQLKA